MALVKGTNSYVSVEDADAYFEDRLHSTWLGSALLVQEEALVTATGILETMPWIGYTADEDQALAWPRVGSYYDPSKGREITFDDDATEAPTRVKNATYELAVHLVDNSDILNSGSSVDSLSLGSLELVDIQSPNLLPAAVRRQIRPLLANAGGRAVFRSW